jgi:hypothetical protein
MGYSVSKRAVRRVEIYLTQMVVGEGKLNFPTEDASKTAYYIRQGVTSAKNFISEGEPYVSYARLSGKYIVRSLSDMVVCEPRDGLPNADASTTFGRVSIPDITDVLGIIGAAIKHKAPSMIFPDARLSDEECLKLRAWSDLHEYGVIITEAHVTLVKI